MMQRKTKQRTEIMNYLQSVTSHPTAEEIYEEVKKKIPKISLGTVYRNLQELSEEKEILKLEINGEYHFDACKKNHIHLICKKCKRVFDVFEENINNRIDEEIKKTGFQAETKNIYIEGICKECQK